MPTKIYHIKMNDFWTNVSYSPPHYPRQKNKEIESAKNEINAFKSQQVQFKNHRNCSLSTAQTFGHLNSYSFKFNCGVRNHVHNRFALQKTYCEHDYGSRYWIWMNSYWNVRKSARWKGSSFCDFEIGLAVIWRRLSHFWHFRFLCFLAWVMRRTVANINPKVIHFDAVDFSGHHSKKL